MFFALSKLLYGLVSPLSWVIYPLLWAVFRPRHRRRGVLTALVILLLVSNDFLVSAALRWWEGTPAALPAAPPFDVAIVLTGGIVGDATGATGRPSFGPTSDRLLQPLLLVREGRVRHVLISGGSGKLFGAGLYPDEGRVAADFLQTVGVAPGRIFRETASRNTHENARFTARLLRERFPNGRYLLVTTAFHMRRAMACFRREGIDVTPYPVDFRAGPASAAAATFWPSAEALDHFDRLVREWVGYLTTHSSVARITPAPFAAVAGAAVAAALVAELVEGFAFVGTARVRVVVFGALLGFVFVGKLPLHVGLVAVGVLVVVLLRIGSRLGGAFLAHGFSEKSW